MPQFICAAILVILSICSVALAEEPATVTVPSNVTVTTETTGTTTVVQAEPVVTTQATTETTSQASIEGQVQMSQQAPAQQQAESVALTATDYLDIQLQPGTAKHDFQEFTLVLNNKQPHHVEILQLEVMNGIDEQSYAMMQQEKSRAKKRLAGGLLRGVTSVATSFVPYAGLGSVAAYQAVGIGSQAAYAAANVVENTGGGGVNYSGRVVQRAGNIFIAPSQPFQCLALVPENQKPMIKIIFKDLQTNQIFDLNR